MYVCMYVCMYVTDLGTGEVLTPKCPMVHMAAATAPICL